MKTIKIIHIEDSSMDSELILSEIEQHGINVDYSCVATEKELIAALENELPDIILADYKLPEYSGKEALKTCSSLYSDIPFIFVSGTMGEEKAVELLKHGASDYILKQNLTRLVPAIEYALKQKELELEKRKAEIKLMQSEKKYRNIFETIQDVFCRTDMNGKILVISPSIQRLSGYTVEELQNKSILVLYNNRKDFNKKMTLLKEHGEIWDFEITYKCKDGTIKYVSINAHFFYNNNDEPCGIESNVRDISLRKKTEEELIAAKERAEESDRLKTVFLANISHEIRTPMNGILGFTELLKESIINHKDINFHLQMIETSGHRMLGLIEQIVSMSVIQSQKIIVKNSKVNLHILLNNMLVFFKNQAEQKEIRLRLNTNFDKEELYAYTDREKLESVLINLIGNAIKFTDKGSVEFGALKISKFIEFYVNDTGIGIPEDKTNKIFENFYQIEQGLSKKHEGVGLGLSIAYEYANILGGKIWVVSQLGKGSCFYFIIPINTEVKANNKKSIKNSNLQ